MEEENKRLFGAGVLANSIDTFKLSPFTGHQKSFCNLDFPTGHGGSLVVESQVRRFCSNSFENAIHETRATGTTNNYARNHLISLLLFVASSQVQQKA